jgi:hypothetical protein
MQPTSHYNRCLHMHRGQSASEVVSRCTSDSWGFDRPQSANMGYTRVRRIKLPFARIPDTVSTTRTLHNLGPQGNDGAPPPQPDRAMSLDDCKEGGSEFFTWVHGVGQVRRAHLHAFARTNIHLAHNKCTLGPFGTGCLRWSRGGLELERPVSMEQHLQ